LAGSLSSIQGVWMIHVEALGRSIRYKDNR
jgi:hypothetical protein